MARDIQSIRRNVEKAADRAEPPAPPYFNISPDAALAELGAATGTAGFAKIADITFRVGQQLDEEFLYELRLGEGTPQ